MRRWGHAPSAVLPRHRSDAPYSTRVFTVEDVVRVAPMIKADEIDYAEAYELVELISEGAE